MNKVGKYALSADMDEIELMKMVFELPEKDRMLMWLQGYIDLVIEKMPTFAKDILLQRKLKWEDTKEYVLNEINSVVNQEEFTEIMEKSRKEFALFVMNRYPKYQSLLFQYYDKNLKDADIRKFVYQNRFGKKHL